MAGMDFLQYHARMLGHGKVPGAYWDGPFSFRGRTAVDTPGIPALLHLLQQNTILCITPRTGSFPFSPGSHSTAALHRRNASLFYTACVIHGQHAAACPNLPGQELILFTVKVKGDWLNRFAFQRAHKPLYKGLEQSSLWPQRKAGKIILKIVFQFRLE